MGGLISEAAATSVLLWMGRMPARRHHQLTHLGDSSGDAELRRCHGDSGSERGGARGHDRLRSLARRQDLPDRAYGRRPLPLIVLDFDRAAAPAAEQPKQAPSRRRILSGRRAYYPLRPAAVASSRCCALSVPALLAALYPLSYRGVRMLTACAMGPATEQA